MNDDNTTNATAPLAGEKQRRPKHRRPPLLRIAYSVAEYARMTGRNASAVRREIERKARREGNAQVADLALGVQAHKAASAGRWSIVVPRALTAE